MNSVPKLVVDHQTNQEKIGARTKVMGRRNFQESIIVSIQTKRVFRILIGQC